jgi:hypothetical protein
VRAWRKWCLHIGLDHTKYEAKDLREAFYAGFDQAWELFEGGQEKPTSDDPH